MDDHNTTCPDPNFCYDRLIKRCYSCKRMQRGSRKETIIIMAILWLVILKQRRKRRRKTGKENSQENGKCACILANEAQTNHDCEPRDNDLGQLQCPHLNAVTMITQDDVLKENIPCVAFTRSQEVITSSPHDEKCNSLFPLPATEFGATMLVTTKTIQEDILSKELP
ncbi:PREDICTED: uncharacterized protein LOC106537793 isoform X2 [Thamnophis sirtalis]|uniref:Uncharacterized protein LOC106537793 isoform X2 n=1 Tax=Thamnophis sirtalis TaxID=35019 RepID=A0A6I9XRZ6_9SAUR|nr:PREDICTED: uncharacterized protein LOC106537793 isoform X2 [Thamnophis sirtalis]